MRHAVRSTRRDQILHGAAQAIARHGIGKLGMGDVSSSAAVSRGTLYRYFSSREELLAHLADREGRRFQERMTQALADAPDGAEKVYLALQYAARFAGEHPVLRRIVETDPALVLLAIRERFSAIKSMVHGPLAPLLAQTDPVRRGAASADQLVDWMTRIMISFFLFPDPDPDRMAHDLTAVFRALAGPATATPSARARPRKRTTTTRKKTSPRRRGEAETKQR
jgi:AcrR family transcriptional regulator